MHLKENIIKLLKLFGGDTRRATVGYIIGYLILAGGGLVILTKTTINTVFQLANTLTPLWATIALILLCCIYTYIKILPYTTSNADNPKLSDIALRILTFFGQQQGETWLTTKELPISPKTSFNQTQHAIDQLLNLDFLYIETPYGEDSIYKLSTKGRAFLGKEKLL